MSMCLDEIECQRSLSYMLKHHYLQQHRTARKISFIPVRFSYAPFEPLYTYSYIDSAYSMYRSGSSLRKSSSVLLCPRLSSCPEGNRKVPLERPLDSFWRPRGGWSKWVPTKPYCWQFPHVLTSFAVLNYVYHYRTSQGSPCESAN